MIGLRSAADSREAIQKRAADFYQRRRFWDWSADDQAALDAWLAQSVLHRVAWLRVEAGDASMESLVSHSPPQFNAHKARASHRRIVLPLLAAASIVLVAALGIPFVRSLMQQPADRSYATEVGGRALLKFSDGTQVELNTNTAVRYRMTSTERIIWLDRGEAWFRVAHNAANPFNVVSDGHRITDLGTEFVARNDTGALDVVLVEGRAQLSSESPGVPVATLTPGDEAIATRVSTTITKKTPQELADELAWRRGMLVFRNTKLADAVAEFNRYNAIKLVIADPSIAALKFTAELKSENFADFLQLAETVLKLRINREGNEILLSRGPVGNAKKAARSKRGH